MKKSNLIEEDNYNSDGNLNNKRIWLYDDFGNEIECCCQYPDGTIIYKRIIEYYDNDKREVRSFYDFKRDYKSKSICLYDDTGNQIEQIQYKTDGSLDYKRISKYDDRGNGIEWSHYNSHGSLQSKYSRKFDFQNNQIEWKQQHDSDDTQSPIKTWEYLYDIHGNWTRRIDYLDNIPKAILERKIDYYD